MYYELYTHDCIVPYVNINLKMLCKEDIKLKPEKVLVCITIQKNSKRLIDKGAEIARNNGSKLHILHVERGMSIFDNPEAIEMLEELFEYGKNLGGEVHFLSDENVANRIVSFIRDMNISQLVLGQTMRGNLHKMLKKDIYSSITNETNEVEILILERSRKKQENERINRDLINKPVNNKV